MPANVIGLDHVVVAVRDLERAAHTWRRLGFTLSPRGLHSEHTGTGNYTIMFGEDYLELLGVVAPTPRNARLRAFVDEREGIERLAFTTIDARSSARTASSARPTRREAPRAAWTRSSDPRP